MEDNLIDANDLISENIITNLQNAGKIKKIETESLLIYINNIYNKYNSYFNFYLCMSAMFTLIVMLKFIIPKK